MAEASRGLRSLVQRAQDQLLRSEPGDGYVVQPMVPSLVKGVKNGSPLHYVVGHVGGEAMQAGVDRAGEFLSRWIRENMRGREDSQVEAALRRYGYTPEQYGISPGSGSLRRR